MAKSSHPSHYTDVDDDWVTLLTLQGKSAVTIATITGYSPSQVARSRRRTKVKNPHGNAPHRADRDEFMRLHELGLRPFEIARAMNVDTNTVYRLRVEKNLAPPHPMKALEPFETRLARAAQMVEEEASFADITRTTHISRKVLQREFPGKQWTPKQAGEHAMAIRYAEKKINAAWESSIGNRLTNPPLSN